MSEHRSSGPLSQLHFPRWRCEYESALSEKDNKALFKRVEIAEAAVLSRREALAHSSDAAERQEIEIALAKLRALKKDVLNFL